MSEKKYNTDIKGTVRNRERPVSGSSFLSAVQNLIRKHMDLCGQGNGKIVCELAQKKEDGREQFY